MAAIPEDAPKPEDHKKKKSAEARKAEADGFVEILIRGVNLKIPVGGNIPVRAWLRFQGLDDDAKPLPNPQQAEMMGSAILLGPEQWGKLIATNPLQKDLDEIGQKLSDLLGN